MRGWGGWGMVSRSLSLSLSGELVHYPSLFPECNQSVSRLNQLPTDLWPEPWQSLLLLPAVHINQVNIQNLISGQSGFSMTAADSVPHCWRCCDGVVVSWTRQVPPSLMIQLYFFTVKVSEMQATCCENSWTNKHVKYIFYRHWVNIFFLHSVVWFIFRIHRSTTVKMLMAVISSVMAAVAVI